MVSDAVMLCQRAVPGSASPPCLKVTVEADKEFRAIDYFEPKPVSIVHTVFATMSASSEGERFLM